MREDSLKRQSEERAYGSWKLDMPGERGKVILQCLVFVDFISQDLVRRTRGHLGLILRMKKEEMGKYMTYF